MFYGIDQKQYEISIDFIDSDKQRYPKSNEIMHSIQKSDKKTLVL